MQNIILITRENAQRVSHVSVFLCRQNVEAFLFCDFVNRLSLSGGEKLHAKRVLACREYELKKNKPLSFTDITGIDDRMIQTLMREVDMATLSLALTGCDREVQDKFFQNMSRRAAMMLQEDMEFMGPVDTVDTENAREQILGIYDAHRAMGVGTDIEKAFALFSGKEDEAAKDKLEKPPVCKFRDAEEEINIVLLFQGTGQITNTVSVLLCDSKKNAVRCCEFMNALKTGDGTFIYARRAEQMVEYETEKPLLVRFDQIFDCDEEILGRALAKSGYGTIISAIKGLDPHSVEKILTNVPEWMGEKLQTEIEGIKKISKEYRVSISDMMKVKLARERIVHDVISVDRKMGRTASGSVFAEILKD
jgi:hypothetical protein